MRVISVPVSCMIAANLHDNSGLGTFCSGYSGPSFDCTQSTGITSKYIWAWMGAGV